MKLLSITISGGEPRYEGLTKHYGAIAALDGLTLGVKEGSMFGFLGPNGAGGTMQKLNNWGNHSPYCHSEPFASVILSPFAPCHSE